jgi:glycosyltransferase 2 family protein
MPDLPPDPRPGLLRTLLGLAAGLAVAAIAGWLLGVRPADVVRHAAGVSPWILAACVASALVMLALQALRWWLVLAPVVATRFRDILASFAVGAMLNALLPARGGDLLRVQYMAARTGTSRATLLGNEVVNRWVDLFGWIPSFAVMCATSAPPAWLYRVLALLGGALAIWAGVMALLARSRRGPSPESRAGRILAALRGGVGAFGSRRTWLIALLVAPLTWLWETFVILLAARGFGIGLSPIMAFSVLIAFNLSMVVPSPGAVGSTEAGGTAALAFLGYDQSRALAFMFVYHFSQLLPGIAAGAAVLALEGKKALFRAAPPAP